MTVRASAPTSSSRAARCAANGAPIPKASTPSRSWPTTPNMCIGKKACGLCLKPPFPKALSTSSRAPTTRSGSTGIWPRTSTRRWSRSARPTRWTCTARRMTVDEVLDEVEKDASFYRNSGGGMTLSGGECQLQPDFAAALLAGRPRARHQHGHRNGLQRALVFLRKGAAPRRYGAPRPQADHPGAAQEVDRREQRARSWRTSRRPTRPFPTSTSSPARR